MKDITFYKTYDMAPEGHYLLFKEETEEGGYIYTLKPIQSKIEDNEQFTKTVGDK